jgi:hypothetical protein
MKKIRNLILINAILALTALSGCYESSDARMSGSSNEANQRGVWMGDYRGQSDSITLCGRLIISTAPWAEARSTNQGHRLSGYCILIQPNASFKEGLDIQHFADSLNPPRPFSKQLHPTLCYFHCVDEIPQNLTLIFKIKDCPTDTHHFSLQADR